MYVKRAKQFRETEYGRRKGEEPDAETKAALEAAGGYEKYKNDTLFGSTIYAVKPGDGSAREQAASCQRVLGGVANVASEYATKRYRSNLINWGMLPLLTKHKDFKVGDYLFIDNIAGIISGGIKEFKGLIIRDNKAEEIGLNMDPVTDNEKQIILDGCLMNYYGKSLKDGK
jgi:aconitate hydratase